MEILKTMDTRPVTDACIAVPVSGYKLDAAGIASDAEIAPVIRKALAALSQATLKTNP